MVKNVIIGFLTATFVFFVVFANIKAKEAERQVIEAQMNLELAKENEAKAKAEQQIALEASAKVTLLKNKILKLEEQLANCR